MNIGEGQITAVAEWLNTHVEDAGDFKAWCEARSVNPGALADFGNRSMNNGLTAIANCELTPPEAFAAVAISGFQIGIECERLRRERMEFGP